MPLRRIGASVRRLLVPFALAACCLARTPLPALADDTVRVREGDTLSSISQSHFGDVAHVQAIVALNHLANADRIYAGQILKLPNRGPSASSPSAGVQSGVATWYGPGFEGKTTKCGQVYRQTDHSAASNDLPCGTIVEVTNLSNGRSVVVPVTDTGGFRHPNILDMSRGAFSAIAAVKTGVIPVRVQVRGRAPEATKASLQNATRR